jgi:hypothetical protein
MALVRYYSDCKLRKNAMKRTIFILLAILMLTPAALRAQENESIYQGWGFGFQLGVGGLLPTSSLGDDLKGCALFTGGLNAEYNRLRLKADVAYGQPSFKNKNPYAVYDSQGRDLQLNATANPTLLGVGVQLGYTVWRQGKVSVTPNVGISWNRLSWDLNKIKYEKDDEGQERPLIDDVIGTHENSFGWLASVDIDFKLHGKITDAPLGEGQAHYSSVVRVSPFVTYAKYSNLIPSVKGVCIGATVSYAGFLRLFH